MIILLKIPCCCCCCCWLSRGNSRSKWSGLVKCIAAFIWIIFKSHLFELLLLLLFYLFKQRNIHIFKIKIIIRRFYLSRRKVSICIYNRLDISYSLASIWRWSKIWRRCFLLLLKRRHIISYWVCIIVLFHRRSNCSSSGSIVHSFSWIPT